MYPRNSKELPYSLWVSIAYCLVCSVTTGVCLYLYMVDWWSYFWWKRHEELNKNQFGETPCQRVTILLLWQVPFIYYNFFFSGCISWTFDLCSSTSSDSLVEEAAGTQSAAKSLKETDKSGFHESEVIVFSSFGVRFLHRTRDASSIISCLRPTLEHSPNTSFKLHY